MLSQINNDLENIIRDIRYQNHLQRLRDTIERRLELAEESFPIAEESLEKEKVKFEKTKDYTLKSAFFFFFGLRESQLVKEKRAYRKAKSNLDQLVSEITGLNQEIYAIDQEKEDLKPLQELQEELVELKEYYLAGDDPVLFDLIEQMAHIKVDVKELSEAVQSIEVYQHHLEELEKMLEPRLMRRNQKGASLMAQKLEKLSKNLESELLDVVDRMPIPLELDPHILGKFWIKTRKIIDRNDKYEYSRKAVLTRTQIHNQEIKNCQERLRYIFAQRNLEKSRLETRKKNLLKNLDEN